MEIICLQENLKQALNITNRIIGRNLTLPILNNLLLSAERGKIKISSTNLEIGINCWVPGKINKSGDITAPAKLLSDFVNNLPNKKIEIKTRANRLDIKCEKFKAFLNGLSADEFPIIPKIKENPLIKINGGILKDGLAQVVGMTSFSESRPEISGVCLKFEKDLIKLAATDSFRLAEKKLETKFDPVQNISQIIVPQRSIQELVRILSEKDSEVEIILSNNQILFDLGYSQIISRLIEGQYPDYQQIIPQEFQTQIVVNRSDLINNIRIASLFSGKVNNIQLSIFPKNSSIDISAKDIDLGENKSQLEAKITGKDLDVVFNYRYLLDGLNNIFSDKVIIGLNSSSSPVAIKPVGDDSYNYIVMPIKA